MIEQIITHDRLLPLYYHDSDKVSLNILEALYKAGVHAVEYTNRGQNALSNFRALKKEADKNMKGMHLGIGTIKTAADAIRYMDEGADFIVSPVITEEIARAIDKKISWIPGCMTPTEIALAEKFGAEIIKVFPASILGPEYIKAVREIFPELQFVPTGGIDTDENKLRKWFNAGVIGVGMGGSLIKKGFIENENYEELTRLTTDLLQLLQFK